MNLIFFIYIPLVYSVSHTFMTTYTKITGKTIPGIPEFSAVTTLDGQQIDYCDGEKKELIPRQDWMKEFASGDRFKKYIEFREQLQQIYKINITVLMEQFNHSDGVHTYQGMYGCKLDDETGDSFDEYGYDGEDFITLIEKDGRYTAHVPQAEPTVLIWNNDRKLDFLKKHCSYWLKKFLYFPKATFNNTGSPKMTLLKKNPNYYVECHVTGFYFRETTVLWMKNEQDITNDSKLVESGETLPNEDGTFQRNVSLKFLPDDWKTNQYTCVVEHESLTEPIQKNLTVNETESITPDASYVTFISVILLILICALIVLCVRRYCCNKPDKTNPQTCSASSDNQIEEYLMEEAEELL